MLDVRLTALVQLSPLDVESEFPYPPTSGKESFCGGPVGGAFWRFSAAANFLFIPETGVGGVR